MTTEPCVYGLYAREAPAMKWMNPSIRAVLRDYPADLGTGELERLVHPLDAFRVPNTWIERLGHWILLYVGESGRIGPRTAPRVEQYFGATDYTAAAGQSLKMTLALLFGIPLDLREPSGTSPQSIGGRALDGMATRMQHRFSDMHLSYVQVLTTAHTQNQNALIDYRSTPMAPTGRPWPAGARPLLNASF